MCQIAKIDQAFSYLQEQYAPIVTFGMRIAAVASSSMWNIQNLISHQLTHWRGRIYSNCIHVVTTIISFSILESQLFSDVQIAEAEAEALTFFETKKETFTYEKQSIECDEGIRLDAIRLRHKNTRSRTQKVLIYFLGNATLWSKEHKLLATLCEKDGHDVLCCNYRGTGRSSGFPANISCLVDDKIKVLQSLTTKGVFPKNITFYGYSFGHRIARLAASQLKDEGMIVQLFGDPPKKSIPESIRESFPCFSNEVASLVERFGW